MTKDMETPAALLIAANSHAWTWANKSAHEIVEAAFIAGAEWQKAQWPNAKTYKGAFRDIETHKIMIQVDAADWEGMKMRLTEFDMMRKDRDEWQTSSTEYAKEVYGLRQQIADQANTIAKLMEKITDGVHIVHLHEPEMIGTVSMGDNGELPASTKPADGFVPLDEKSSPVFIRGYEAGLNDARLERHEVDRLHEALNLKQTQSEQDRTAFHHMSDKLTEVRTRNRALRDYAGELIEENARIRLALANAKHGDV